LAKQLTNISLAGAKQVGFEAVRMSEDRLDFDSYEFNNSGNL
jgi:hypothetical protein